MPAFGRPAGRAALAPSSCCFCAARLSVTRGPRPGPLRQPGAPLRVYSAVYGRGRVPSPHVVPTSLTWRNPPSNPPGSYLSGGRRRRRRRRAAAAAVAAAAAAAAKAAAAGLLRTAGWEAWATRCGAPGAPRFSAREGSQLRAILHECTSQ